MARPTLMGHRKFRRLCRLLGRPRYQCRGILELIWDSANESGEPILGDDVDVELTAEWDGKEGELVKALESSGLIESKILDNGTTYEVHNFWHHCPAYVRKRRDRELMRREQGDRLVTDSSLTAERRRTAVTDRRSATLPHPHPLPHTEESPSDSCPELPADGDSGPPPVAIWIPIKAGKMAAPKGVQVRGENGSAEAGITRAQVEEYGESYGMEPKAVFAELKKARQWCIANPVKQKTPRGIMSFVNRWMDKAANSTGSPGSTFEPRKIKGPTYKDLTRRGS